MQKKKISKNHERYFGSSKWLKQDIKQYGLDNFNKEIIETCNTAEELSTREIYYQKLWNVKKSDNWYNMHIQGEDFDTTGLKFNYSKDRLKKIWPEERRKALSDKMKIDNLNFYPGVKEAKSERMKKDNPSFREDVKKKLSDIKSVPFIVNTPKGDRIVVKNNGEFVRLFGFNPGFLKRKKELTQGKNKGFSVILHVPR